MVVDGVYLLLQVVTVFTCCYKLLWCLLVATSRRVQTSVGSSTQPSVRCASAGCSWGPSTPTLGTTMAKGAR